MNSHSHGPIQYCGQKALINNTTNYVIIFGGGLDLIENRKIRISSLFSNENTILIGHIMKVIFVQYDKNLNRLISIASDD